MKFIKILFRVMITITLTMIILEVPSLTKVDAAGGRSVTLIYPNGGETLVSGKPCTFRWTSTNTQTVTIAINYDGTGTTWEAKFTAAATDGYTTMLLDGPATNKAIVKIIPDNDWPASDNSDGFISIVYTTLTLSSPNGGENWSTGTTQTISWSSTYFEDGVMVAISRQNGADNTWEVISGIIPSNINSFQWVVMGPATQTARIKIVNSRPGGSGEDISDGVFTIRESLQVITQGASAIGKSQATLNGNLVDMGNSNTAVVSFDLGTDTTYNLGNVAGMPSSLTSTGTFTASLVGLTSGQTYHFRARAVGKEIALGGDVTFTTSGGEKLVFISPTSTITAGSVSEIITIQIQDNSGNPVAVTGNTIINIGSSSSTGKFDIAAGGSFNGSLTSITIPARSNSADFYFKNNTAGVFSITASSSGFTSGSQVVTTLASESVQVRVESAADGSGSLIPDLNLSIGSTLTVYSVARDQFGNFKDNISGTLALVNFTGGVAVTDFTVAGDSKSATLTARKAGSCRIRITAGSLTPISSGVISIVGTPILVVTGFPSQVTAGSTETLNVSVKDGTGNTITDYTGTVGFSSTDKQAGLPANYTFTSGDSGTHDFTITLKTAAIQSITVTDIASGSITGGVSGINVIVAAPYQVRVENEANGSGVVVPGNNLPSGTTLTMYAISRDRYGNFIATIPATWSLPLKNGGVDNGDLQSSGDAKSAVFTSRKLGACSIRANVPGLVSVDTNTLYVIGIVKVTPWPLEGRAGTPIAFTVSITDTNQQPITSYDGTLHFNCDDKRHNIPSDYTYGINDKGIHTFSATFICAGSSSVNIRDTVYPGMSYDMQFSITYSLNISIIGNGIVTRNPDNTGYPESQSVQLTATPASGYYFIRWEGDLTGNANPVTVITTGNKTIKAVFSTSPNMDGGGGGSGGSIPPPINPTLAAGETDVTTKMDLTGKFTEIILAKSADNVVSLNIDQGITAKDVNGNNISKISIQPIQTSAIKPPEFSTYVTLPYELSPGGTTFSQSITVVFSYNQNLIPPGIQEKYLTVGYWNGLDNKWEKLEGMVNTDTNTITVKISHFSIYTVMAFNKPADLSITNLIVSPSQPELGNTISISIVVKNDGDLPGNIDLELFLDNTKLETRTVTLEGNSYQKEIFYFLPETAKSYNIRVNNLDGNFVVKSDSIPSPNTSVANTLSSDIQTEAALPTETTKSIDLPTELLPSTSKIKTNVTVESLGKMWLILGVAGIALILGISAWQIRSRNIKKK